MQLGWGLPWWGQLAFCSVFCLFFAAQALGFIIAVIIGRRVPTRQTNDERPNNRMEENAPSSVGTLDRDW